MIDFLKYRYVCFGLSGLLLLVGIGFYLKRAMDGKPGFQYHIDFVGGTELTLAAQKPLDVAALRQAAQEKGWDDLTIQSIGFADKEGRYTEFIVRMIETADNLDTRFKRDVNNVLVDNKIEIRGVSRVGAEVGRNIQWNSIMAVLLSLLIVLLYISIRSQYGFAVGAVVAIVHDMLMVLVAFLILQEQISVQVLAAILAILGYSLNDTIVIFSRVRKNFKLMPGRPETEIVNVSINQTLRRTLFTSITTLLTILSIFFFGGAPLYGFALAMLIGIVAGTYSSVYIASPVMLAISVGKSSKV